MGFFDFISSLFGGNSKLEVTLDASEIPEGGFLSGKVTLTGGPKQQQMNTLKVRLLYVHTETQEDSALPKIDTRVLLDNTIASNVTIEPSSKQEFSFTFQVPKGTEPTAHNTSYTVQAQADIPSAKDPTATAKLKVVEADEESGAVTADTIFQRWPALRGTAPGPLSDALRDMRYTHYEGDPASDLIIAEPLIARIMKDNPDTEVKRQALDTWSTIVKDRNTYDHTRALMEMIKTIPADDVYFLQEALQAAGKFAKKGGLDILQQYATHDSVDIRREVVSAAHHYADDDVKGRRELILSFLSDASAEVRREAVDGLGEYMERQDMIERVVQAYQADASPEVQASAIYSLGRAFWGNLGPMVVPALQHAATNPYANVRKSLVRALSNARGAADTGPLVALLLQDSDAEVRQEMAYEICNFQEAGKPFLATLRQLADNDVSPTVRRSAISSLAYHLPVPETEAYYRSLIQTQGTQEEVLRGVVHGIKFRAEPEFKQILKELSNCPFIDVAREARDGFSYEN